MFNLMALIILVAGVLYLNPFRDSLVLQREVGLVTEAKLIANVLEAQLPVGGPVNLITGDGIDPAAALAGLDLQTGVEVYVFDRNEVLIATTMGNRLARRTTVGGLKTRGRNNFITGFLNSVWDVIASILAPADPPKLDYNPADQVRGLVQNTLTGGTQVNTGIDGNGSMVFAVSTPILQNGRPIGVVALISAAGEIDELVLSEREQVLQMFVIAILVSIGLSLVLASTIANPLSDLAAAAEVGRDKNTRKISPGRVRIPDLSGVPMRSGAFRVRCVEWYQPCTSELMRTSSLQRTPRMRSRIRWHRCGQRSARCGLPGRTTSAVACWM